MLAGASSIVAAENSEIGSRRAAARVAFTDDEIKEGFFKIAFGAELQLDKPAEKIRKFDEPVRIFVDGEASPDRRAEIAAVINDIRTHINHLDLALTDDRQTANFTVVLVPDRKLNRAIRARHGKGADRQIKQSLNPQCLSGIGRDKTFRIRRAEPILPIDAGDFTFYDCAYEELLQGLGPINDDATVPWTMSNDDVQMGFFRRLRSVPSQHTLRPAHPPWYDQGRRRGSHAGTPEDGTKLDRECLSARSLRRA
jgi:hypothetical protein